MIESLRIPSLHKDKEKFKEIISLAAEYFDMKKSHVEKDYWLTRILCQLSQSEYKDNVYFKGGTSLLKAFDIIKRFSEDLDLYVDTNNPNAGGDPERNLNNTVYKFIVDNNEDIHSENEENKDIYTGIFCRANFIANDVYMISGLKKYLQVESSISTIKRRVNIFQPFETRQLNSIIGNYLKETNRQREILKYKLFHFDMKCILPEKTLCDKISRMIRLSFEDNATLKIATTIRDVYDITELMNHPTLESFINGTSFIDGLIKTFLQDELQHKYPHCGNDFTQSPIFTNTKDFFSSPEILEAYKSVNDLLINPKENKLPPIEDVVQAFERIETIISTIEKSKPKLKSRFTKTI